MSDKPDAISIVNKLRNPEEHYPGNFNTAKRAAALLMCLCQDAADEIQRLQDEVLRRAQPAQAGQVLTDERLNEIFRESFKLIDSRMTPQQLQFARAIEAAVLAKRVPMTDDTALIRQLAVALDRCRFDSLNMSIADMKALSEARIAASKRLGIVGEKGGA